MVFRVRRIRRRSGAALVVLSSLAMLASACGASSSVSSSSSSSSSSSGVSTSSNSGSNSGLAYADAQVQKYSGPVSLNTPAPIANPVDLKGKTVWYIPITNSVDSLAGIGTTMAAALSHVGVKVHVCDGGALPTTIVSCMTTAAQQGAALVVTSYIDYAMVPTAFQALEAKNIPVLVAGEPVDAGAVPNSKLQFLDPYKQTDLFQKLVADLVISDSKGQAHVMLIQLTDSSETKNANAAQLDVFKKYCPKCTVNSIQMQTATISQMPSTLSAALVSHPNTNYVVVQADAFLPPAMGGIQSAGFAGKVKVITADGGLAGLKDVAAGTVAFDPGSPIEWQGWQDADAVIRMLSGLKVPAQGDGPTRVFGPNNIKSLDLTHANYLNMSFYGVAESAFEAPYLRAWKAN